LRKEKIAFSCALAASLFDVDSVNAITSAIFRAIFTREAGLSQKYNETDGIFFGLQKEQFQYKLLAVRFQAVIALLPRHGAVLCSTVNRTRERSHGA
jgi:hypothetical protein